MKIIRSIFAVSTLFVSASGFTPPSLRTASQTRAFGTSTSLRAEEYDYDFVVIGAGSGGVRASRIAAGHGAKTAILEGQLNHGPPNYSAVGGT
jgi:ribulose 1,5-bisphosphate synthetase/thiazole synthase